MKLSKIKIDDIQANLNQPRKYFDEEKIEELSVSIKNHGLIQPIIVRKIKGKSKYEIIAGERRYRACLRLNLEKIDCIEIDAKDLKSYEISVLENVQRENLNPIEEAESYKMLMEVYGYTQEMIATRIGKTRSSVSNVIRLLKLPLDVKEQVALGNLSYGHARTLLGLDNDEKISNISKDCIKKGYSVRKLEEIVKNNNHVTEIKNGVISQKTNKIEKNKEDILDSSEKKYIESKLQEHFETKVSIINKDNSVGKIEIEFYNYSDLERIIELLNIDFE